MFNKQTPEKITGNGPAAGCQVFYPKIYGFFYSAVSRPTYMASIILMISAALLSTFGQQLMTLQEWSGVKKVTLFKPRGLGDNTNCVRLVLAV